MQFANKLASFLTETESELASLPSLLGLFLLACYWIASMLAQVQVNQRMNLAALMTFMESNQIT